MSQRPPTRTTQRSPSDRSGSSLATLGDIESVEDDQHVEQASDDDEGVAVLVGNRHYLSGAGACRARDKVRQTNTHIGQGSQRDQRLGKLKGEQRALEPEPKSKHGRQREEEDNALLAPAEPQMAQPRHQPRRPAD